MAQFVRSIPDFDALREVLRLDSRRGGGHLRDRCEVARSEEISAEGGDDQGGGDDEHECVAEALQRAPPAGDSVETKT